MTPDRANTPPDRAAHRAWLASLTTVPGDGRVVDLGCGRGEELHLLAACHAGAGVRLLGVDASAESLAAAAAAAADPRVEFRQAPLDGRLPFDDGEVDLAYSHNLLECLPDPDAFAREVARIVRPGGQVVMAHWDWDTQLWDGPDRALVRRLVATWADFQQPWMAHADPWMGRRLRGVFDATGCFHGEVRTRVLTNTRFAAPWFGHANAVALLSLARRGLVSEDDVARFLQEQSALDAAGRYWYAITGFAFVGRRR